MERVDLFYLSPNPYGGWVTFTAHLMRALRAMGVQPYLYKIRPRTEKKSRDFGYGEKYRNVTLADAMRGYSPRLIVAAAKNFREQTETLLGTGAKLVVHDPTELKNLPDTLDHKRCAVIRKVGHEFLPEATFIRHPYERRSAKASAVRRSTLAVSTSRIDFDKHTEIILEANMDLPPQQKVKIYGFENRLYTRFKIVPKFPHWQQSVMAYPRTADAAFSILSDAYFSVDMSEIKNDGGGTQYTTLEAWDAGAIPIINTAWLRPNDDMQPDVNCLAVENAQQLKDCILGSTDEKCNEIRQVGWEFLNHNHNLHLIGQQYIDFLKR